MARAKLAIRRYGVKLIVVDYLRLAEVSGRELRERVGEAANTLRKLAKQENVAVVGLSQLKRPENINDRPSMIDLKESGDIEAHAHTVLLLYQPQDNKGEFTREDEIIIGKQRNGPLGSEPVRFNKDLLQFEPREQNL
jgi:replicative DNA helicase